MPSEYISDAELAVAKARTRLDEYQRRTRATEFTIEKLLTSSQETVTQSRDLLDRIGRDFQQ